MPSDAGGGSVMPQPNGSGGSSDPSATVGVTAEMRAEIQRIVAGVVRDAIPRALKPALAEAFSSDALKATVLSTLESIASADGDQPPPGAAAEPPPATGNRAGDGDGRLTMKALQDQLAEANRKADADRKAWQTRFEASEKQRTEAEGRTRDMRARSEARAALAKVLGADSPHIDPLMSHHYDVGKRFVVDSDGNVTVKFKGAYGEEEVLPLAGAHDRFAAEFKPYLPAATSRLPPASPGAMLRGQQLPPPQPGQPQPDPLKMLIASAIAPTRPEVAQAFEQAAHAQAK